MYSMVFFPIFDEILIVFCMIIQMVFSRILTGTDLKGKFDNFLWIEYHHYLGAYMGLDSNASDSFFLHINTRLKSSADLIRGSNYFLRAFWHFGKDLGLLFPVLLGCSLWGSEQGLSIRIRCL